MECPVCFTNTHCSLVCGHGMCLSCAKEWYFKSPEPTCPMCRGRFYFNGFHKYRREWDAEREEAQKAEAFSEAIDVLINFDESDYDDYDEDYEEEYDFFRAGRMTDTAADTPIELEPEWGPPIEPVEDAEEEEDMMPMFEAIADGESEETLFAQDITFFSRTPVEASDLSLTEALQLMEKSYVNLLRSGYSAEDIGFYLNESDFLGGEIISTAARSEFYHDPIHEKTPQIRVHGQGV